MSKRNGTTCTICGNELDDGRRKTCGDCDKRNGQANGSAVFDLVDRAAQIRLVARLCDAIEKTDNPVVFGLVDAKEMRRLLLAVWRELPFSDEVHSAGAALARGEDPAVVRQADCDAVARHLLDDLDLFDDE